jgi:hypothetical protein
VADLTPAIREALDALADGRPAVSGRGSTHLMDSPYRESQWFLNANVAGRLVDMGLAEYDRCPTCGQCKTHGSPIVITTADGPPIRRLPPARLLRVP